MNIRGNVNTRYALIITTAIIIGVATGIVIFRSLVVSGYDATSALLLSYLCLILIIAGAGFITFHFLKKQYTQPIHALHRLVEDARSRPVSSALPDFNINNDDNISQSVNDIYTYLVEQHQRLQQVLHFSSLASHELRTPLTIIRNQLEDGLQSDVSLEHLNTIVTSTYDEILRLHHLVNDLLTISTLQAGTLKLDKEEVAFHTFIKEFYDEALFLSREKNISIVLAKGPQVTIQCDPRRFRQVMFNLLDNAIKYTPEKGKIYISHSIDDGSLFLQMSDTGAGIPAHLIGNIFEPFYQVSRHDQSVQQGAGLGLSLVRWIVDAHGGSVYVESEEGKGTTVTIRLPIRSE